VTASESASRREIERGFLIGIGRAAGGAVVFALPVLMTMEMWQLGATIERWRLAVMILALLPLLVGLCRFVGFEETHRWSDDVRDALVAFAVGFLSSIVVLTLFGLIDDRMSFDEALGAVVIETVPASIGAALAQGQFGERDAEDDRRSAEAGYTGELVFMAAGALFLSFSVAPTEEVVLIAASMAPLHAIILALVSIGAMHAVVYVVQFSGQEPIGPEARGGAQAFLRFTVVGYAIALAVVASLLWTLGRLDGQGFDAGLRLVVVLGFPAAIGAAFARLIV
jgi:putative integral membrane protein (TIGR02587 family)